MTNSSHRSSNIPDPQFLQLSFQKSLLKHYSVGSSSADFVSPQVEDHASVYCVDLPVRAKTPMANPKTHLNKME